MVARIQYSPCTRPNKKQRLSCEGFLSGQMAGPNMDIDMDSSDDIVYEIMKHMDAKSLAIATCVSKKWNKIGEDETLWEHVSLKHWPTLVSGQSQMRTVVLALGGFRRLYVDCLRPLLARGRRPSHQLVSCVRDQESGDREWSKDEVHLSLSLFSIDCYERLGRRRLKSSPLKLLCKPSASLSLGGQHVLTLTKSESNVR